MRSTDPVPGGSVAAAWAPLALSWAMMGIEQPVIAAVIARLPDPELSLAAYGGVVYPLALVIEAPIIMLLSASTELSRDRASYRALQAFTHRAGAVLTMLHLLVAATPLYEIIVASVFAVPEAVAREARLGLLMMLPWSWAIAWRRLGQGVLIRFGHSRTVGVGTLWRVAATGLTLAIGAWGGWSSGVVVAGTALSLGVVAEGMFVAWAVRPIAARELAVDRPEARLLRGRAFWAFYLPLASLPFVSLVIQPLGTAAIGRMPEVLESLAVWPVVTSLLFFLQAPALALAEVVVAKLDEPRGKERLRRFVLLLASVTLAVPVLFAATPLSELWFRDVIRLPEHLVERATLAFAVGAAIPACRVFQSWYQGQLVAARNTRGASEAVAAFALTSVAVLSVGVVVSTWTGLLVAMAGYTAGRVIQTLWIALRVHVGASKAASTSRSEVATGE